MSKPVATDEQLSEFFKEKEALGNELEEKLSATNKTSLMIAYERSLEANQENPLFVDPYAAVLAGTAGKNFSEAMAGSAVNWGLADWPDFHRTWTAVRTAFIDKWLIEETAVHPNNPFQFVNLGAGVDTRSYRMDCLKNDKVTVWEVDLEAVNAVKTEVLKKLNIQPVCSTHVVNADLATNELPKKLAETNHNPELPTHWLLEGLIMYLPLEKQHDLLQQVIELSASGSTAVINFAETDIEPHRDNCMTAALLVPKFEERGWSITIHRYGDPTLNFGRFPKDKDPLLTFSFAVCRKK